MKKEVPNAPQARTRGEIWRERMINIHGSEENMKAFMRQIAKSGGKRTVTKGFGTDQDRAKAAGKKSGQVRRAKRERKLLDTPAYV